MLSSNPRRYIISYHVVTVFTLEMAVIQKRAIKQPVKLRILLVAFLFISSLTGHFGLQFFFQPEFIPFLKFFLSFYFYFLKPFYILPAPPEGKCSKCFSKGMLPAMFQTLIFYMSLLVNFLLSISLDFVKNMKECAIFFIYPRILYI